MHPSKQKDLVALDPSSQEEDVKAVRRTCRNIKRKKDDDFVIGLREMDRFMGQVSEDEVGGKRHRKYNYYDEYSDYEENHRYAKKRQISINSVEGLLQWKYKPQIIDEPNNHNSKVVKVKNICTERLESHFNNIQALFVNIQWGQKGQTMDDFRRLPIQSLKIMEKGLVFIWGPKHMIYEILSVMEEKQFAYVENLQIINLDKQKATRLAQNQHQQKRQGQNEKIKKQQSKEEKITNSGSEDLKFPLKSVIDKLDNVDPQQLILSESAEYFSSSKRTLLIFRRKSQEKVQLRHQRTCDVVFDMPDRLESTSSDAKIYIYNMIQTMLPKCLESYEELKMVELWGEQSSRRRGWITLVQI